MKKVLTILLLTGTNTAIYASNEIGPEGHKLIWFLGIFVVLGLTIFVYLWKSKDSKNGGPVFPQRNKVAVEVKKDKLYRPRYLELIITNNGKSDIDLGNPLLILKGFWYSRKFKLKGNGNNWYYPLYLMKDQSHTLNIDLQRFYGFDKTLKRLPKVKIVVNDVKGRRLGSKQVLLRKTLF